MQEGHGSLLLPRVRVAAVRGAVPGHQAAPAGVLLLPGN